MGGMPTAASPAAPCPGHPPQVRARREQVDAALRELQGIKGPGCGARVAGRSGQADFAPQLLSLKAQVRWAGAPECRPPSWLLWVGTAGMNAQVCGPHRS